MDFYSFAAIYLAGSNVCGATVGVHPFMAQIFDLSPLRLSLQSELPPYEVIPDASFILITGCSSRLNRVFEPPHASFLHLVGRFRFYPQALKGSL